jgi:hypothetical protein
MALVCPKLLPKTEVALLPDQAGLVSPSLAPYFPVCRSALSNVVGPLEANGFGDELAKGGLSCPWGADEAVFCVGGVSWVG